MLKLARCSFAFAAMFALLFVATASTVNAGQNSAGPTNRTKASKKATKKSRKPRKVLALPIIVSPAAGVQATAPAVAPTAPLVGDLGSSTPTSIGRETVSASRSTGGLRILPVGVPSPSVPATAGQLVISEFRVRGPSGANDEFIEIYNNSGADHTVDGSGTGTGYAIAASDGVVRCSIPDGTLIRAKAHFLCVNSIAYSIGLYPASSTSSAGGDVSYKCVDSGRSCVIVFHPPGKSNLASTSHDHQNLRRN